MKITLVPESGRQGCDLLAVPVFAEELGEKGRPSAALAEADAAVQGVLLAAAREEQFRAKADSAYLLHAHGKGRAKRVLLVGLGERARFEPEALRLAMGRAAKTARKVGASTLVAALPSDGDAAAQVRAAAEGLRLGAYTFERYKSPDKNGEKHAGLKEARLALGAAAGAEHRRALELAESIADGVNLARDLVNEPANELTPTALANHARQVAREGGLAIEVLRRDQIEKLGMGMFLAVARGSAEPPALVHLGYTPRGKAARGPALALVGKAITFDSGGLSLKQTDQMIDMKNDMGGAAAVIGAMKAIARLKPPFPVDAYFGACENMPGGRAYKLGDVLRSRLGKTVEIANTDAEGRLVLGDVLAWAAERNPSLIVDVATLTGACAIALGNYVTGVLGAPDDAVQEVLDAAQRAGEAMWRLPLVDLQREGMKSEIADLKNIGERYGGAINAALFLKEFVGDKPWVHLDIAAPALSSRERGYFDKGATGVAVRTLVQLVLDRA